MRLKKLHIHTTEGYSGELVRESQILFGYRTEEIEREISLTMPLRAETYNGNRLPGVLRQNLPEGFLLNWLYESFGKAMKMDDFNIIALTGKDMIGRVRCLQDLDTGNATQPGEDLASLLAWKGSENLFGYLAVKYAAASGISGVQPKVLVSANPDKELIDKGFIKDRHLIIKASGADYPGLAENEYHCMTIGRLSGIKTPQFWISDNREIFVIERFDVTASRDAYLGFEDMTALTGKSNQEKYDSSYENIAKAIVLFSSETYRKSSLEEFFKSLVLSIIVRNGDAHLKNFGLIYTNPRSRDSQLSPLYDIVNTTAYLPKDNLALKLAKSKAWPTRDGLIQFGAQHCLVDRPGQIIDSMIDVAATYRPDIEPGQIWTTMHAEIDRGLKSISSPSSRWLGTISGGP